MRCKNCKDNFDPINFNQKYCLKNECIKVFVEVTKSKAWKLRKSKLKEEVETVQSLFKKAQKVFNTYIRQRDNDTCISCGSKLVGKYDAGHFWSSGGHKYLTFNEDNVHSQCVYCNQHKHGNLIEYRKNLINKIGKEKYLYLQSVKDKVYKPTREELKEIIEIYKLKKTK